jgi:serine/threonine protein kinase
MENGNVLQFLDHVTPTIDCTHLVSTGSCMKVWRRPHSNNFIQALDIAKGLEYLHSQKVIHGDLKGVCIAGVLYMMSLTTFLQVNILISRTQRAFLADFGLATTINSTVRNSSTFQSGGTLRWQAPELFRDDDDEVPNTNTMATDIYAFAMVCYEASYTGI